MKIMHREAERSQVGDNWFYVASPRIELGSGASETLILSIVLRGHYLLKDLPSKLYNITSKNLYSNGQ